MIQMIATDLDDTLLRTDKTVSSYTFGVIEKVRARGIKVIFATGRGNSTGYLLSHELFDGHVHLNGAKAYVNDRLIYDRTIPSGVFAPLLRQLDGHGMEVAAEIDGTHFSNFDVGAMIMHKEARKSRGVSAVAQAFGIDKERIVAFGDDDNDVDMLLHCGLGVAVANATDRVREVADTFCESNDRDGVARWMEEHILAKH